MGAVVSALAGASRERQSRKRKQFHTVELKVRMDCDGCELKVRNTLARMRGMHAFWIYLNCFVWIPFFSYLSPPSIVVFDKYDARVP
jgi:hypothetical protein